MEVLLDRDDCLLLRAYPPRLASGTAHQRPLQPCRLPHQEPFRLRRGPRRDESPARVLHSQDPTMGVLVIGQYPAILTAMIGNSFLQKVFLTIFFGLCAAGLLQFYVHIVWKANEDINNPDM